MSTVPNTHAPGEQISDWKAALALLEEGNKRYLSGNTAPRVLSAKERQELAAGQKPFAAILTCADSRTPPEIIFDQNMGNIFVVRNAGNFADNATMGSLEFATAFLKAPLVIVMGHSQCGAVEGALAGAEFAGNLGDVIGAIRPGISGSADANEAIKANILANVKAIKDNAVIKQAGAQVLGAFYDIATGKAEFYK